MECIHLSNGLTILEALKTDTNGKGGPLPMVFRIGTVLVNFDNLLWVEKRQGDILNEDPVYTFHFVSGEERHIPANMPLRVDIEMALAKWQGIAVDPTNNQTVSIPAIRKTRLL